MKASARTFLGIGVGILMLQAGPLRAEDAAPAASAPAPASAPKAPEISDYQSIPHPSSDPYLDAARISGQLVPTAPDSRPMTPEEKQAQEREKNWLFSNIADQQKAAADKAKGIPANGLGPDKNALTKPDAAALLAPYSTVSLTPGPPADAKKETATAKDAQNTDSDLHDAKKDSKLPPSKDGLQNTPTALSKASTESPESFKPSISGLSADATKLLTATPPPNKTTDTIPAADAKLLIAPINPDLIKPIDLGGANASHNDRSDIPAGSIVLAPMATNPGSSVPSGFDVASAPASIPTFNPASSAPLSAPTAPSNPTAPAFASPNPIPAINPIQPPAPIAVPAIPVNPPTPTAFQAVPTAGPSRVRVKDPTDSFFH